MANISPEDQETIREFLVESHENLSRLDQDLVALEKHPDNRDLLSSIFRTIHTIKGACGFLAFSILEAITHQAETLLSQLRDGKRELTPALVSLILETVDATRKVLAAIEVNGKEGDEHFEDLTERLRQAAQLPAEPEDTAIKATAAASEKVEEPAKKKESSREEDAARPSVSAAVDANIRVGVGLLDKLMDLVGDWFTPQHYSGEATALTMAYRDTGQGVRDNRTFYLYAYQFALNTNKTVASITLPGNRNVVILAATLTGPKVALHKDLSLAR
jgi:chemotaxis protein histidine kinase CheA